MNNTLCRHTAYAHSPRHNISTDSKSLSGCTTPQNTSLDLRTAEEKTDRPCEPVCKMADELVPVLKNLCENNAMERGEEYYWTTTIRGGKKKTRTYSSKAKALAVLESWNPWGRWDRDTGAGEKFCSIEIGWLHSFQHTAPLERENGSSSRCNQS